MISSGNTELTELRLLKAMLNYDGPQGHDGFRQALADSFRRDMRRFQAADRPHQLQSECILHLFNLLAGDWTRRWQKKKVLFPLCQNISVMLMAV